VWADWLMVAGIGALLGLVVAGVGALLGLVVAVAVALAFLAFFLWSAA